MSLAAWRIAAAGAVLFLMAPLARAHAQTDYYNTDAGRPLQTEDAYAIERRAIELQIAPFRLERARGGTYRWGIEPEIAVGLFPRTQLEVGFPLAHVERGVGQRKTGLAGIELSALYNLNAETRIPALAIAVDATLPAGPLGPDQVIPSIKGIATKTLPWARFHLNGRVTFKESIDGSVTNAAAATPNAELSRWVVGLAVDRTFPLQAMLLTAEVVARQPLDSSRDLTWDAAAGTRYQLSPRLATDLGGGYRLSGDDGGWYITAGAAVALGLPWRTR